MQYILAITLDESVPAPAPGDPGFAEMREAWTTYGRALASAGVLVDGASLTPSSSATTMRIALGTSPTITDGPYVEAKEQLAGYYRIEVEDLDAALAWAGKIPLPFGVVEVRPVRLYAGPDGTPTPANP
ncbi:YciI family protein [Gordonia sp. NPDC003424]